MICVSALLISSNEVWANQEHNVTVRVNGIAISMTEAPAYIDTNLSLTYVPLRFVSEALGAEVSWNSDEFSATAKLDKREVEVGIDRETMKVTQNGTTVGHILEGKARLDEFPNKDGVVEGRTMVPLRAISEGLGAKVDWTQETSTVDITLTSAPVQTTKPWETWTADPENSELAVALFEPMKYDKTTKTLTIKIPEFTDGEVTVRGNGPKGVKLQLKKNVEYVLKDGEWAQIYVEAHKNSTGNVETYCIYPSSKAVRGFDSRLPDDLEPVVIDSSSKGVETPAKVVTLDAIFAGLHAKK
jgi:hypothetical protein